MIPPLPNPFLQFAESAPANRPAASTRLDKPVDAAGSSTPLGGTATAPGMVRGSESRFVLDEVAFMFAIDPFIFHIPNR